MLAVSVSAVEFVSFELENSGVPDKFRVTVRIAVASDENAGRLGSSCPLRDLCL